MSTWRRCQSLCVGAANQFAAAGRDFLYPPACLNCDSEVGSGVAVCDGCRSLFVPEPADQCQRCAAPVGPYLDTAQGCIHCRRDRFAFRGVLRLGVYQEAFREACLKCKQSGGEPLAAALAELLFESERPRFENRRFDLAVPVPRHWSQRLLAAHDPPMTIAARLARKLRVPVRRLLVKVRRTPRQTSLPATARRGNLRGAFRARGRKLASGTQVLLVDDVLTTGTTAHEAARVLLQHGAAEVIVAVLARGLGQVRSPEKGDVDAKKSE